MQNRPDTSLLKNNYLTTYHETQACLIQHNFSLLLSRKIEKQIFDILITAQNQKVPAKKLEFKKNLDKFCDDLLYEYNKSVSIIQQICEGIFTFSLLIFFFTLLDVFFEKGLLMSTLITCILVFIGFFITNTILRYKKSFNTKMRSVLILLIVLIPFVLLSFLKSKIAFFTVIITLNTSIPILLLAGALTFIFYSILSKKYDMFVFMKKN